jgi:ABC-type sugar transport system substrate-binding protein
MRNHEPLRQAVDEAVARHRADALTRATFLRRSLAGAAGVAGMSTLLAACGGGDSSGGGGGTTATASALKPDIAVKYDASTPAGAKPSGLPRRFNYVAFSTDPFWVSFSKAMSQGAKAGNIDFGDANAQGDASKYLDLVQQQVTRGFGSTFLSSIDPRAESSIGQQAIEKGAYVIALSPEAGVTQIGENQKLLGRRIGEETAKYVNARMGGRADMLLFNEGTTLETLKERYQAIRDAIRANAPGITIVKDLTPRNTADDGFKQASSAFAANPDISVVVGPALATLGALSALESTGKASPDMYIASIGGTDEEITALKKPNSALKASWADPWLLVGYMCALWTGDWLDGKAVPMGVQLQAAPLTVENYQAYAADMAAPSRVVSSGRVADYLDMWGSINYQTRSSYYAKTWNGPTA